MEGKKSMGTFLSLCYTAVDTICLILFLDVFEQRRFDGLKFHLHVLEYVLLSCWIPLILSIIVGHNQALKILIILLIDFIIAKRLYTEISTAILCFFVSLEYLLSYYDDKYFRNENGSFDTTTNVTTITKMVKDKYDIELNNTFQIFGNNNAIFPFEYFCAKDLFDGKIKKTHNTYTIHHFSGSWLNEWGKIKQSAKIYLSKFLGRSFVEMIAKIKNIIK